MGADAMRPARTSPGRPWLSRTAVALCGVALVCAASPASGKARRAAPRFSGRVQVLSGAGFTLPTAPSGERSFAAYAPVDLEVALRLSGLISVALGGVAYAAPFSVPGCGPTLGQRPSALASFVGLRLDLNNSRDGSWLSPWLALRGGLVGQAGVPVSSPAGCAEALVLSPWLGPRAGLDLWLGRAAVTFALGYDLLPRASAVTAQVGLTLRLF